jgi:hypothetical protein
MAGIFRQQYTVKDSKVEKRGQIRILNDKSSWADGNTVYAVTKLFTAENSEQKRDDKNINIKRICLTFVNSRRQIKSK